MIHALRYDEGRLESWCIAHHPCCVGITRNDASFTYVFSKTAAASGEWPRWRLRAEFGIN
jgi:hypothetical protein